MMRQALAALLALSLAGACSDDASPAGDAAAVDAPPDAGLDAAPLPCDLAPQTFWLYDLSHMPPGYVQQEFTCRGQGLHENLWVSDDIWGAPFDQTDVDNVLAAFDHATPADGAHGIYDNDTSTFGDPTDVDGNGRIDLLYYSLAGYGGYEFDGFIRREDILGGTDSNDAEVLYLDGVRNDPAGDYMLGVIAHEFEHMIMLAHDTGEDSWLDESLAEAAMVRSGYLGDLSAWVASDFAGNPTQTLTDDSATFNYGPGFLHDLVADPGHGVASLATVLTAHSDDPDFGDLLTHWAVANFLDAPDLDGGVYGYTAFDVPALAATTVTLGTPTPVTASVAAHSARYFTVDLSAATVGLCYQLTVGGVGAGQTAAALLLYPASDRRQATVTLDPAGGFTLEAGIDRATLVLVETGGTTSAAVTVAAGGCP